MPGLGTSFGRGGATTAQQDLANADCILIEGSSMAEAHPVGFRWVMKAKEQGATIIHVDPRFSRTSALADIWVPIRAGTDIVFLGGLINHLIEYDLYFREYVVHYTNASCILSAMNIAILRTTGTVISQGGTKRNALTKATVGFTKAAI